MMLASYRLLLIGVLTVFFGLCLYAQQSPVKHHFQLGKQDFLLDGKPYQIISGEMHPARVPKAYWQHRLQMIKAMGCNTVAVYVFWNYHEQQKGVFDFSTDNKDIAAFLALCQQEGLWVLLRPGPYVCAEWDFGGLPPYLLQYPDIKIRCMDMRYITAVHQYVQQLARQIKSFQVSKGGPMLMLQIENEYGSYGNDKQYLDTLAHMWRQAGIDIPFYTADGPTDFMLQAGSIANAAIGLDSGSSDADFAQASKHNPQVPSFSSETYPGWLTHWQEPWQRPDTNSLKASLQYLLQHKKSFNLYVAHGGTNFGYTAGANAFASTQYQPDITSYDYDAPINEQGQATPKFYMIRRLIQQHVKYTIPPVPAPMPSMAIAPIPMHKTLHLWNLSLPSIATPQPQPFESFGQNQGMAIYSTTLIGHQKGTLKIWEPHDFVLVFLDGQFIDTIYRDGGKWEVQLPATNKPNPTLELLVEGMGHINFAQFMIDRKGITDRVTLNGNTLMQWKTTLLPMNETFIHQLATKPRNTQTPRQGSNFFEGSFELNTIADTYFDVSAYRKGVVFVNGHNLGRYWHVGPQQRLFCPATWLHKGKNTILVFDFWLQEAPPIRSHTTLTD